MEITLQSIEAAAKEYASARDALSEVVESVEAEISGVKRRYMNRIKTACTAAAEKESALRNQISSSPKLFEKPRTVVLHGIRVGYRKGTGSIVFDDEATVIDLIEKRLKDQADVLIKTTKELRLKAVGVLEVSDLKRIGCQVESTDDQVVCKAVDSEVEKLVKALLKGAQEEGQ